MHWNSIKSLLEYRRELSSHQMHRTPMTMNFLSPSFWIRWKMGGNSAMSILLYVSTRAADGFPTKVSTKFDVRPMLQHLAASVSGGSGLAKH